MSHFLVDNDSANHNQEANGLFNQSEEPKRDGCPGTALAFTAVMPLLSAVPGFSAALRQTWYSAAHPARRPAICRSVCPARSTCCSTVEEIQSSEEALIHHTSPAACHLNAKYFHCIFKSKQEEKWARGEQLVGIKAYKGAIESAEQTLRFFITVIFIGEKMWKRRRWNPGTLLSYVTIMHFLVPGISKSPRRVESYLHSLLNPLQMHLSCSNNRSHFPAAHLSVSVPLMAIDRRDSWSRSRVLRWQEQTALLTAPTN